MAFDPHENRMQHVGVLQRAAQDGGSVDARLARGAEALGNTITIDDIRAAETLVALRWAARDGSR